MVTLEKFNVFGYRIAREAQLETNPPHAGTGAIKFEDLFCFSHVYLFVRHCPFLQKKVFSVSQIESVLRVAHFHPA